MNHLPELREKVDKILFNSQKEIRLNRTSKSYLRRREALLELIPQIQKEEREKVVKEFKNYPKDFVDKYGEYDDCNVWSINFEKYFDDVISHISQKEV